MFKLISTACAAIMALSVPMATQAIALPVSPAPAWNQTEVLNVDFHRRDYHRRGGYERENWRHRGYDRRGDDYYYRGYRGYREHRPGYRRHGELWFPPAAFIAGAIIGGALNQQPPVRYQQRANPHFEWCYARYRSYRTSDNTFQPYNGPRRQCISPYG